MAIALGSIVIGFSGGITRQSYTNVLIVAAFVLVPLEVLRQSGALQRLIEQWRRERSLQQLVATLAEVSTVLPSTVLRRGPRMTRRRVHRGIVDSQEEEAYLVEHPVAIAMRIANQQAAVLLTMGRLEEALEQLEQARRLGERSLGQTVAQADLSEEQTRAQARDRLRSQRSIELAELLGIYLRLAEIYQRLGQGDRALEVLSRANELNSIYLQTDS